MSLILLFFAALGAAPEYQVRITQYQVRDASPAQIQAFESEEAARLIASMRDHVRATYTATTTEGQVRQIGPGTVRVTHDADDLLVTLDALPFYRGSTLRIPPCVEHRLTASRGRAQGQIQIALRTVRVDDGRC